jgi:ketosteroid isomerase-like protein
MNRWHPRLAVLLLLASSSMADQANVVARLPVADIAADEAAIREADAEWVKAAQSRQTDAWVAFYTDDAMVMLPNNEVSNKKEDARKPVGDLLALPEASTDWQPTKIEVAHSGDLAYLAGTYKLSFRGSNGSPITDSGKIVRIWRKQSDGRWKCIVDIWKSEPPASPQAASPSASPRLQTNLPVEPTTPAVEPSRAELLAADYGEMPTHYQDAIHHYFKRNLMYPDSIQYQGITQPEKGYTTTVQGLFGGQKTNHFGWTVKATISTKNSFGEYSGSKSYTFLFRGDKITNTVTPAAEDKITR